MWEVGQLDDEFLLEVKKAIEHKEDLELAKELGADDKFIRQRQAHLEKFLAKISVKKEKPKKRVAPPIPVESKYKNGAVMIFQYTDDTWEAIISVDSTFYDKETYYGYIQTDIKMDTKPTINDVLKAHIIDPSFHSLAYNSFRGSKFYYSFVYCIGGYLSKRATKKFETYNDSFFEIIGNLSDWEHCSSGTYDTFSYYSQKTADEFKTDVQKELTKRFNENPNVRTKMTIEEINKEFIEKKK